MRLIKTGYTVSVYIVRCSREITHVLIFIVQRVHIGRARVRQLPNIDLTSLAIMSAFKQVYWDVIENMTKLERLQKSSREGIGVRWSF